ncbi:C1 family peptidase [Pseudodesulfovibrio sediminis]|uniref:Peptidase C1A papain C-terminal domain-containing protein n=1 Tax=Pseudodesulfovibrio sediminis TaxID=2810563 RepID=A0ABN6EP10_9BACT|nr:C1 family peptidase [Pseudodesulfovibrio sediminis]BCS88092.1 hypothetical protein PSDVSF_13340 [Pseudodesulfovibrio sediminis]
MTEILRPEEYGLGDEAVEETFYNEFMVSIETLELDSAILFEEQATSEYDARDYGLVSPPKDQGTCGSCWAFAAAGTMESKILKFNGQLYNISEQQLVSCNTTMKGCCGGDGRALLFYQNNKPWLEHNVIYYDASTRCPEERTRECQDFEAQGIDYLGQGFYTVPNNASEMKKSLLDHGPCYFRYDVYEDFYDYWKEGQLGAVYQQESGNPLGGHAVQIIGWSDSKGAWLLKNSWGRSTGPNQDGTFWIAYEGHMNPLQFQMFNLSRLIKKT